MRSKSSNAVEKLLESEHVDVELLDERSYKARKYISDEETAKLFIKYYDGKIDNLNKKVADSSRNLTQAKYVLWAAKFIFASLGALGSIDVYRSDYTGDSTNKIFALFVGSAGAVLFINTCLDAGLSYFGGKNSIVKEELRNCIEERYKVEKNLYDLQQKEAFPHARADLAAPRRFQTASTSASVYSPERGYIG